MGILRLVNGFYSFTLALIFFFFISNFFLAPVNAAFDYTPLAWWAFDNPTGAPYFYSNATPPEGENWSLRHNGTVSNPSGYFGRAVSFNSSDDFLELENIATANFTGTEQFIIAGWINWSGGGDGIYQAIWSENAFTTGSRLFGYTPALGVGYYGFWGGSNCDSGTNMNVVSGRWTFIVGVQNVSGASCQFWAYDPITDVWTNGSSTSEVWTSKGRHRIGGTHTVTGRYFSGKIDNLMVFNGSVGKAFNWSAAKYLKDNCDGTGFCLGLEFEPITAEINPSVNSTTYNFTINITANGTNLTRMYINATGAGANHNNNLSINLSLFNVSRSGNITNYTYGEFIGSLGYGDFVISVFNATNDQIGSSKTFNINLSVPTIIKIQDQVTSTALANIDFTYTNRNITNGLVIIENSTTNSSGEITVDLYRFGDFNSITLTTTGITGYFDGSQATTLKSSANQRITFNLEPIGGAGQVILIWLDNLNYQPVEGIEINTTAHGSGTTGTWGKISFVGTIGETITGRATKTGYLNKSFSLEIFTREETIYLIREGTSFNQSINVWVEPEDLYLDNSTPEFLFINVLHWASLQNLTVAIAKNNEIANLYDQFGLNSSNVGDDLTVYSFFFNNTDWCNASTLCTGDSNTIRFRPESRPLREFGGHVVILIDYYDKSGFKREYRRGGIFIAPENDVTSFLKNFSPEQLAWLGLGFVLIGTVAISARLKLTFFQAGVVSFMILILNVSFEIWPIKIAVFPGIVSALLMFRGATE